MAAKRNSTVVFLLFLVALAVIARAQPQAKRRAAVKGTLRDNGHPIADADIILQSFENENCAKLFSDKKPTAEKIAKLNECSRDQAPVHPNAEGAFEFGDLQSGWYAMRFLWSIDVKPSQHATMTRDKQFVVLHAGHPDVTGRYDTMAQGKPFFFSAKEDFVIRFSFPDGQ